MTRSVNIEAPTDNPDCGMIPDTMAPPVPRRTPIKPSTLSPYDIPRIVDHWMMRDWSRLNIDAVVYPARHAPDFIGEGWDPTRSLTIDCDELIADDPGAVPTGRPGDNFHESGWATRLRALHIKG